MAKTNKVKITILVENNTQKKELEIEHGLSFYINGCGQRTLFDTGQSDIFLNNAQKLSIDLSRIDQLVLSHGHYDHTGGLAALGKHITGSLTVFHHPKAEISRFSLKEDCAPKRVGISEQSLNVLLKSEQVNTTFPCDINSSLHITGEIPRLTDFEDVGGPFYLDYEGHVEDPIIDDQALWFANDKGLIIILGCAHAGIINTINYCKELSGIDHVHALIGGFHLVHADQNRMDKTVAYLKEEKVEILAACHCTGPAATKRLKEEFPESFKACHAGSTFNFTSVKESLDDI